MQYCSDNSSTALQFMCKRTKWQSGPQHLLLVITQKDKSVIVTCTSRTETADAASTTSALCKLQYRERANAKLAKNPK